MVRQAMKLALQRWVAAGIQAWPILGDGQKPTKYIAKARLTPMKEQTQVVLVVKMEQTQADFYRFCYRKPIYSVRFLALRNKDVE